MHFSTENFSTAIEYFARALQGVPTRNYPDRFRLFLRISDCHRKKGSYSDARVFLEKARASLGEAPSEDALGKVEFRDAYILLSQGNYEEALRIGFSAYKRLKHSSEHGEVADLQLLLANCYHRLGLASEAEDFFMDALSSYRRIEDRVGIAYVYNNLGLLHKNACRWNRAIASLSKSLEIAKTLGLSQHLIRVQLNLGVVYSKLRRFADALSCFNTAAGMAERFGDQHKLTKAILMQGRTYVMCGDLCKAEKHLLRGQAMAIELGYGRESALADEYLGELMMARGHFEEAMANFNNGLRKARKHAPEGDVVAEILRRIADVHLRLNHLEKVLVVVDEGIEIAQNSSELYELGFFHRSRALARAKMDDLEGAVSSMRKSIEMFDKHENWYEKAHSQQMLARLHMRCRDEESVLKAKQLVGESVVGFGKIEESHAQILSQMILAVAELKLGNLDDALLAIYEADRLAEEEQHAKFRKVLRTMRGRVEAQMASATTRVLDQFTFLSEIQGGATSREKLITGLESTLRLILDKLGAEGGFVAVPNGGGRGRVAIVCRENLPVRDAERILGWYEDTIRRRGENPGLLITDVEREPTLGAMCKGLSVDVGRLIFQQLGFEDEALGVIALQQETDRVRTPLGQEALHFVAAYSRLISLSVFELVRNEKKKEHKPRPTRGFESIVTENREMIELLNLAERVAHSDATVLLQGETGTGKGLIAYAVHLLSERRDRRFVHVNCAAMPESLLESELFGHVRGSFTGAISDKDGLLRRAHGGTIFLDEIGKTSLAMQGKLLQFLDTGKVRKVGSNDLMPVDVRVICASKADLMRLCDEGRFLEDFFYRINDFPLIVPPLRDRREDIGLLLDHYLRKMSQEMKKVISGIAEEALRLLVGYHWPGNVRELEKVVKRAVILADDGDSIGLGHIPAEVRFTAGGGPKGLGRKAESARAPKLRERIAQLEKEEILDALRRNGGNKSQSAIELGISYPNLLAKIKRYNLRVY